MATYTENYQFKKPEATDIVDIEDFNSNADLIDAVAAGLAEKALTTFVGVDAPSDAMGRDNDIYLRRIGAGSTKKISTLNSGERVKLNENGTPTEFIFLEHNHYGRDEATLIRKNTCTYRRSYDSEYGGNTMYRNGVLDDWCQSVYSRKLDDVIQKSLVRVSIPTVRGWVGVTYMSDIEHYERSCFMLSRGEVSTVGEGELFPYFEIGTNRIAYRDDNNIADIWWLRSVYDNPSNIYQEVWVVRANSNVESFSSKTSTAGYRPAITLSSDLCVSADVDDDGCYTVVGAPAVEMYRKVDGAWARKA